MYFSQMVFIHFVKNAIELPISGKHQAGTGSQGVGPRPEKPR